MNYFLTLGGGAVCLVVILGCWLGWQLLRQNGRILLRLDELEKRLDELEFGESEEERGSPEPQHAQPGDGRRNFAEVSLSDSVTAAGEDTRAPGDPANRFSNRSLARSRIKRDGLEAGTAAPGFRLPRLDGGELTLEELRGKRVLLVFSDPHCGPCNALAPQLEQFHREHLEISVVMISRGEPEENRAKVKEHGLTFPVVLQQRWEISRRYAMFATPLAYLIDENGIITHDAAVGVEPILALLSQTSGEPEMRVENPLVSG